MEREENLIAAFKYFDKDGSGYITIDELQQACKEFGLGEGHLDETIKEIDLDNVSFLSLAITLLLFLFPMTVNISLYFCLIIFYPTIVKCCMTYTWPHLQSESLFLMYEVCSIYE